MAVRAGIASSTVARLENGSPHSPKLAQLQALAEALGCTVADLLADEVKAS